MFNKRLFAVISVSLLLAACGGGGGDEKALSREPGVLLLVNGAESIADRTMDKKTIVRDDKLNKNLEICLQDVVNADSVTVQIPYYDNYEDMGGEASEYCDGRQEIVTMVIGSGSQKTETTAIAFQVRFLNSAYNDMTLTYRGVGVEIRIYDESDVEVWNSIVAQDLAYQANGLAPFDSNATHSEVLKSQFSYPSQKNFAITYYFFGIQNYSDFDQDPSTYLLEDDFVGLGWVAGDRNHSQSDCEPFKAQPGTVVEELGTTTTIDDRTRLYQKPLCQPEPLPPGRYRVVVEYSFTPAVDPVEFFITIKPEST
jgi:hypothetical protein